MKMSYSKLNDEGYLVVDVFSKEEVESLIDELVDHTFSILFPEDTPRLLNLLTDQKLRNEVFGYNGNDLVWQNGNSRTPYFSKSTGMFEGHYNLKKLEMIDFNPKLYEIASKVMCTEKLVHRAGLERYSIKPGNDVVDDMKVEGSTSMPLHLDANVWYDNVNFTNRIQSLICLSCDTKIDARNSGSLRLLTNFHHYWKFIGALLHPLTGLYSMPDCKSRFHVLPKDFEKVVVPVINDHIEAYTLYLHNREKFNKVYEENEDVVSFYEGLKIKVPKKPKLLTWRILNVKPGQMVFWSQYLPHMSCRNKSSIPRIVCYYSLYTIEDNYYDSEEHKWLLDMVTHCKFYYGRDKGNYDRTNKNGQELEYLKETEQYEKIIEYIKTDPLARLLTGQDRY